VLNELRFHISASLISIESWCFDRRKIVYTRTNSLRGSKRRKRIKFVVFLRERKRGEVTHITDIRIRRALQLARMKVRSNRLWEQKRASKPVPKNYCVRTSGENDGANPTSPRIS
jgi:hypothetical protein